MTEPTPDEVPTDEALAPATPGARALPSTDDDGGVESGEESDSD